MLFLSCHSLGKHCNTPSDAAAQCAPTPCCSREFGTVRRRRQRQRKISIVTGILPARNCSLARYTAALRFPTNSDKQIVAMPLKQKTGSLNIRRPALDGHTFCHKVYQLFSQTRAGVDGIANLRLRPTEAGKRLLEELIPLARLRTSTLREGRRIKVRWLSGSQPYDAILLSSGRSSRKAASREDCS